jgi:UDP-2,3-diacylglucosamine pyrophosphatase LpxH
MTWFSGLTFLAGTLSATAVTSLTARWAVVRLRRVQLRATGEHTPMITPDAVRPRVRRLVVSDLHLGAGDQLDEFTADAELAAFVRSYAGDGRPTELILGGDTFEFLQVLLPDLDDYEWSATAAGRRLATILAAHPEPVAALRAFVAAPENQLTVLIGNHDFELHYASAKRLLHEALGLEAGDGRLRLGSGYEGGDIYLVHGNQFDPWNRFVHFEGVCEPFEVVRGTRVVKDVINRLKLEPLPIAPLLDNIKPLSALVWHLLSLPRLRDPAVRGFVARALLMLGRSLPRVRPYIPPAPGAASAPATGSWRRLRRRGARDLARMRGLVRRVQRSGAEGEDAVAQIKREARHQLRREVRAFRGDTLRAAVRIAHSLPHAHNRLFVCGHTHLAQVVALSERQTYVNTGTWTDVVLDAASGQRVEQRFPFLEVTYDAAGEAHGRLLVWQDAAHEPLPWAEQATAS